MPLPLIPIIIGAASALVAGKGVQKGLEAKKLLEQAQDKAKHAKRRYEQAKASLDERRDEVNQQLSELGEYKKAVFISRIGHLVKTLKTAQSSIRDFESEVGISAVDISHLDRELTSINALDLGLGVGQGAVAGGAAAFGAYGMVGMFAAASTGTAISSLTGVAATNATLAWLGGGSLAAGGWGMAAGGWVLGGVVAGPALLVTGYVLASKAEEAMTQAEAYRAEANQAIAVMDTAKAVLDGLENNVQDIFSTLQELAERYDRVKIDLKAGIQNLSSDQELALQHMLVIGKAIKEVINISLLDEDGGANPHVHVRTQGFMEVVGDLGE